jgi:hypothetical protein
MGSALNTDQIKELRTARGFAENILFCELGAMLYSKIKSQNDVRDGPLDI